MTKLLLRLFVKNHHDTQSPAVRTAIGQMAGGVGIGCNLLLFAGKLLAGILSGSVAITADAFNNLSDAASSIVTLLGFQLARRPADKHHPYGHGRYEYLSGLAISVLILFMGLELLKSSVSKIISPGVSQSSTLVIGILIASMGLKLWMSLFYRRLGRKINSTTLLAAFTDSKNDVITTGAVLLSCLVESVFQLHVDGYAGAAVSLFILYSGMQSAKQTISPLLGSQADEAMIHQLSQIITSHDKIMGIHDLLVHDYGPGQCYASVHAELSAQYDPMQCHEIIDHIENEVLQTMNIQLVIHFDPVSMDDQERVQLQAQVEQAVKAVDPAMSVHDLRLDRNEHPHLVCFDLVIPYSLAISPEQAQSLIRDALPKSAKGYRFQIQIDRI